MDTHGQSQDAFAEARNACVCVYIYTLCVIWYVSIHIFGISLFIIGLAHRLHHPGGRVVLVSLVVVKVIEVVALEFETRTKSFT